MRVQILKVIALSRFINNESICKSVSLSLQHLACRKKKDLWTFHSSNAIDPITSKFPSSIILFPPSRSLAHSKPIFLTSEINYNELNSFPWVFSFLFSLPCKWRKLFPSTLFSQHTKGTNRRYCFSQQTQSEYWSEKRVENRKI